MKFLSDVFLPVSPFIPTSPFINFGDFCQPPRLFRPPLLFQTREYLSLIIKYEINVHFNGFADVFGR